MCVQVTFTTLTDYDNAMFYRKYDNIKTIKRKTNKQIHSQTSTYVCQLIVFISVILKYNGSLHGSDNCIAL